MIKIGTVIFDYFPYRNNQQMLLRSKLLIYNIIEYYDKYYDCDVIDLENGEIENFWFRTDDRSIEII
jgi:hypothetical protein